VREPDARRGDPVDVRGGDGAVRHAAAVEREVVVAEVVGDDHDDVGRARARRRLRRCSQVTGRLGPNRVHDPADHARHAHQELLAVHPERDDRG